MTIAAAVLQELGPLASPPAILVLLVVVAILILVGRVMTAIAWRLVKIAIVVVVALWILGMLGFQFGIL